MRGPMTDKDLAARSFLIASSFRFTGWLTCFVARGELSRGRFDAFSILHPTA